MTDGKAPALSRITITFGRPGAADHVITPENVEPAQVFAAAWMLDQWARELRQTMVMAELAQRTGLPDLGAIRRSRPQS